MICHRVGPPLPPLADHGTAALPGSAATRRARATASKPAWRAARPSVVRRRNCTCRSNVGETFHTKRKRTEEGARAASAEWNLTMTHTDNVATETAAKYVMRIASQRVRRTASGVSSAPCCAASKRKAPVLDPAQQRIAEVIQPWVANRHLELERDFGEGSCAAAVVAAVLTDLAPIVASLAGRYGSLKAQTGMHRAVPKSTGERG